MSTLFFYDDESSMLALAIDEESVICILTKNMECVACGGCY